MSTILETSRLLIQPIHLDQDLSSLLEIHNNRNTMRWIPNNKVRWTAEDLAIKYQLNQKLYPQQLGLYKIVLKTKETTILIGELGLFPCINSHRQIEIGYILHEFFWKKGLATELLQALLIHLEQHFYYTVVCAQLFESNVHSKSLLERCGFQYTSSEEIQATVRKLIYHYNITPRK
ncbi:GNAT family N-acetyltransferase [Myroides fluvii]|uniref:GNAT family N-acetyltransferase n=1 Tax=Myroides fluvii TaxID=2572594 RepID=UPI00131B9985|nr:GNAT family N-acetyltransferase [Myroides fluvii]